MLLVGSNLEHNHTHHLHIREIIAGMAVEVQTELGAILAGLEKATIVAMGIGIAPINFLYYKLMVMVVERSICTPF